MKRFVVAALVATSAVAPAQTAPTPPTVAQKPYTVKGPQDRVDPYYWLRDDSRKNPDMLAYLNAENAYADAVLAPTKPLQDELFKEIVGHIKQDDSERARPRPRLLVLHALSNGPELSGARAQGRQPRRPKSR